AVARSTVRGTSIGNDCLGEVSIWSGQLEAGRGIMRHTLRVPQDSRAASLPVRSLTRRCCMENQVGRRQVLAGVGAALSVSALGLRARGETPPVAPLQLAR